MNQKQRSALSQRRQLQARARDNPDCHVAGALPSAIIMLRDWPLKIEEIEHKYVTTLCTCVNLSSRQTEVTLLNLMTKKQRYTS